MIGIDRRKQTHRDYTMTAKKPATTATNKPATKTTAKKTTAKKPAARKAPSINSVESRQLQMSGWRAVAGEFMYGQLEDILEKAVPLAEYKPSWYVRGINDVPAEKLEEYTNMLRFPGEDGNDLYIIQDPLLFW